MRAFFWCEVKGCGVQNSKFPQLALAYFRLWGPAAWLVYEGTAVIFEA